MKRYEGIVSWVEAADDVPDEDAFLVAADTQAELVQKVMEHYCSTPWSEFKVEITKASDILEE